MLTLLHSSLPSPAGSQLPHVPDRDPHPTPRHHLGHRPSAPHRVPHVPPSTRCFPRPLWDPLLQVVPALLSVPPPGPDPCSHVSTQISCGVRCLEPSSSTVAHVLTLHHAPLPLSAPLIPSTAPHPPAQPKTLSQLRSSALSWSVVQSHSLQAPTAVITRL